MSGPAVKSAGYEDALAFLYGRINYERISTSPNRWKRLDLGRMRRLLEQLGNPQQRVRTVHLAGTKGKGSTATMVSSILRAAGYRVGLYTSPHLNSLEERFLVDGLPCSQAEMEELVDAMRPVAAAMEAEDTDNRPTFFELTTALAWLHFERRAVDVAVVEVGMGGRLDSTNVCQPLVTVITSISFDHTRQLGNTLGAIAGEKAGIIKPGVEVVSGVLQPEPREVVRAVAADRGCQMYELESEFGYELSGNEAEFPCQEFLYREAGAAPYGPLRIPLAGQHQVVNATLAVATCRRLPELGLDIPSQAVLNGLASVQLPARVEFVSRRPWVIVDTAHNVASAEALVRSVRSVPGVRKRTLLFGATQEKDVAGMLTALLPAFDAIVITRYRDNPRAADPQEVFATARSCLGEAQQSASVHVDPSASHAWDELIRDAADDDLICVTGSFFLAAELRDRCRADCAS